MTSWTTRVMLLAALTGAGLAAGCAASGDPVFGEWSADTPGSNANASLGVDLVLYGGPDATSGRYTIKSTAQNPNQFANHGTQEWGGPWTSTPGTVNGRPARFISLHEHLPDQISGYALTADGRLHALNPDGSYNASRDGALYTLSPVRPRG